MSKKTWIFSCSCIRSDLFNASLSTEFCKHQAAFLVQSVVVFDAFQSRCWFNCRMYLLLQTTCAPTARFLISVATLSVVVAGIFSSDPSSFFSLSFCLFSSCWPPSDEWLHLTSLLNVDWNSWLFWPDNRYISPVTDAQYSRIRDIMATYLSVGWSCVCSHLCVCFLCVLAEQGRRKLLVIIARFLSCPPHIRCSPLSWNLHPTGATPVLVYLRPLAVSRLWTGSCARWMTQAAHNRFSFFCGMRPICRPWKWASVLCQWKHCSLVAVEEVQRSQTMEKWGCYGSWW